MTRTFANPEELMIALLQGEKWSIENRTVVYEYEDKSRPFRIYYTEIYSSFVNDNQWNLCDGKTLWYKVEEKTELDLMKELYELGNHICISRIFEKYQVNHCPIFSKNGSYKLIHKKHKDILDAYLADNSVEIESFYMTWLNEDNFIGKYNEDFEYRLKPKKKTVQLAMFTCKNVVSTKWISPYVCGTLKEFKEYYNEEYFINHHELPNTRYEQEIDDE